MPPTNTYKIQLEQIKSAQTDDVTKDLASQLVKLTHQITNLTKVVEKQPPSGSAKDIASDVASKMSKADAFVSTIGKLLSAMDKLGDRLHTLPGEIRDAISQGKATIDKIKTEGPIAAAQELKEAAKKLSDVYKVVKESETYKTGKEGVLKDVDKLLREVSKEEKAVGELVGAVKDTNKILKGGTASTTQPAATNQSIAKSAAEAAKIMADIAGADKTVAKDIDAAVKRFETAVQLFGRLSETLDKLGGRIEHLPEEIKGSIKETVDKIKTQGPAAATPELLEAIKMLTIAYKNVKESDTYNVGREGILKDLEKVINELMKRDKSVNDLVSTLKELHQLVGVKQDPVKAAPTYTPIKGVQLLGRELNDLGVEFEKIKNELQDKIVVAIDLETSSIRGKEPANFGKKAAEEFLTQIAYKKGTLAEIRSGTAKEERVFIKPEVSKAQYLKAMGGFEGAFDFEQLEKEGKNIKESLQQVAEDLADAHAIMGHNIAEFDMPVLENQFKNAGIQLEKSVENFVDTVNIARTKFPERLPAAAAGGMRPHSLGRYERDFKTFGVEIKNVGGGLHDASYDLEVLVKLLNAFEDGTQEYLAAQADLTAQTRKLSQVIDSTTANVKKSADDFKKHKLNAPQLETAAKDLENAMSDASGAVTDLGKTATRMTIDIGKISEIRSGLQAASFTGRQTVMPHEEGRADIGEGKGSAAIGGDRMADVIGDLAISLNKLQSNIVASLEKGLSKGMTIIKNEAGEAFQLAEGGREFELNIADVTKLKRSLGGYGIYPEAGTPPDRMLDIYKSEFVKRRMSTINAPEDMATELRNELRIMNKDTARGMGELVENLSKEVKAAKRPHEAEAMIGKLTEMPELQELYKSVALGAQAQREATEKFIKRIAIPAANITPQGTLSFETKYGAERALSNFATITTGLEKLVSEVRDLGGAPIEVERFGAQVSALPMRITKGMPQEAEAEKLAAKLINRVVELGGRATIGRGYSRSIAMRSLETGSMTEEEAQKFARDPGIGIEELISKGQELKIKALDIAKALDEIKFENFYEMLDRLFQAGKVPLLEKKAGAIGKFTDSTADIREITKVISDLSGLLPMIEPGQPKRREYDEHSVRVLTKAMEEMRPAEEKQHIIDVAMIWKEMAETSKKLGENLVVGKEYLGVPQATSLDLSDASSSQLRQFNLEMGGNLKELNKTMTAMSTADIRGLAPFEQFSSIQRQMSYAASAIEGGIRGGEQFETPSLMSAKERALIESGRYGTGGYGLNVLTELRNTAGTFEDQIIISGKLAEAFTEITKRLVKPAEAYSEGMGITAIEPGLQDVTTRGAKMLAEDTKREFQQVISEVADQFQEILGVPQRYKGRADIAEIGKEVENVVREHRGQTIEVQTAKITEVFLNYFGRKFSTRFGTKGVSISPTTPPTDIKEYQDVIKAVAAGLKAVVEPGTGLGHAKVPKSMGQLVSEIFEDQLGALHDPNVTMDLHNRLIESGNKFILDMFKDAAKGLVTEEEARKQAQLFEDVNEAWKKVFAGEELPTDVAGVKAIKEFHQTERKTGEAGLYTMKPIEARISSRGIAKRGLMPEILEGLVNNLIGTTAGTTTLKDAISREAITETEEARKALNEVLSELGYEPFKDINDIIKRLNLEGAKPEKIQELIEWEKEWSAYTQVVNEFGEQMQSFVAPKFLQIIEEPHKYKDWSELEIEKGMKGARLDFQSFAAMAGVFGEGSQMLKEMAEQTSNTSQIGWELIKTFQMLDPTMRDMRDTIMKNLPTYNLKDVQSFEAATGTVTDFKDTLFDISKFPTEFKLKIPTAKPGAKEPYEEMYIPGAAIRATYPEQLMGKEAPTNVARYLANLVNAAKSVEDLMEAASSGGVGLGEEFQRKFAGQLKGELTTKLTGLINEFKEIEKGPMTTANVERMESTIKHYIGALSEVRPAPPIYQKAGGSERESVESFMEVAKGNNRYSQIMGRISDILIGANPDSLRDEMLEYTAALKKYNESGYLAPKFQAKLEKYPAYKGDPEKMFSSFMEVVKAKSTAKAAFDVELEAGNLDQFAKSVGLSLEQNVKEALERGLESLGRAKVSYARALGEDVLGKKKGIEEVFFARVTPAVTGKTISAITDKTDELRDLLEILNSGQFGLEGVENLVDSLEKVTKKHVEYVSKAKQMGLPVLRPGEIGLAPGAAEKVKVRTGEEGEIETNLAELIKKQQEVFVESIRYPFTGTASVQPHKARLMEGVMSTHSIAVPGAPELDLAELNRIIDTLREHIGLVPTEKRKFLPKEQTSLIEQRESEWAKGTEESAAKAIELTDSIDGLIKVINAAIPTFTEHEQKLDFDGDTLFVHTGQLEQSREEIRKHYDALKNETDSVRNLFRSVFTAVKEGETASLAEMSYIFSKKHPEEKGFKFLTKPYIEEDMAHLGMDEVMKGLFTYSKEAAKLTETGVEPTEEKWQSGLKEWSQNEITKILGEVFTRFGATEQQRLALQEKVGTSKFGMPDISAASDDMEAKMIKLTEEMARRSLWEKKYSDAIAGQLYKLHTGQTVEGISRVARVSELETGFGAGIAGTGRGTQQSTEFLKRWPAESMALGGKPVEAFATRVNEIMRFVIQKGMDVKHAGVEAVGTQIIANIGKATGADMIMKAMNEAKDQFSELADFNAQIQNEVRLRLGALSTEELKKELKLFEPDIDLNALNLSREDMMQKVLRHVDLRAVFEELFRQIKRQAIAGLAKKMELDYEAMTTGPSKLKLKRQAEQVGGFEFLASKEIEKKSREKGISLYSDISEPTMPLYGLRTSMATTSKVAKKAVGKFETEEMFLPQDQAQKLKREFEDARKAANVLSSSMRQITGEAEGGGIYNLMVSSAIQHRYKELAELEKLDEQARQFTGQAPTFLGHVLESNKMAMKLWADAVKEVKPTTGALGPVSKEPKDFIRFLDDLMKVKAVAKDKLEEITSLAGLPIMSQEEQSFIGQDVAAKYTGNIFNKIKSGLEQQAIAKGEQIDAGALVSEAQELTDRLIDVMQFQAVMAEQTKRAAEIVKTIPMQREYLEQAFPKFGREPGFDIDRDITQAPEDYTEKISEWYKDQFVKSGPMEKAKEAFEKFDRIITTPPPDTETAKDAIKEVSDAAAQAFNDVIIKRKREALQYLESKAAGKLPAEEVPLHEMYRASGVHGGGRYGGGTQQEAILEQMLGIGDKTMLLEATAFKGSAIHRKKQRQFVEKFPGTEIEKPIENLEDQITGHIDVLYEDEGKKILADIKTVYSPKQFSRLQEISKEISKRQISIQDKLKELKSQGKINDIEKNVIRRLEDYISQVNVYLKGVEGAVGEIIVISSADPTQEVTIPLGTFDPTRFAKDLEEVKKAREKINKLIANLEVGAGIPPDLFAEYPRIQEAISAKLQEMSAGEFVTTLPKRPIGEVPATAEEVLGRLTTEEERMYQKLSKEYLEIFEALGGPGRAEDFYKKLYAPKKDESRKSILGVPPFGTPEHERKAWEDRAAKAAAGAGGAGMPPGGMPPGGGGGFDDDDGSEEFKKRLENITAKLRTGREPDVPDVSDMMEALDEATERIMQARSKGLNELADGLEQLVNEIHGHIEATGRSLESYRELARMFRDMDKYKTGAGPGADDLSRARRPEIVRGDPDRPEAMHKNLRALFQKAVAEHRLAGEEEYKKFGDEITNLIKEAQAKGSTAEIPQRISDVISRMPEGERGAMRRIWMHYKKAISDYYLKRLDTLLVEIEKGVDTPEGREAYLEYVQTIEKFLSNIRGTQGRMSDIYTRPGATGKKTEFVDPELARLVGIYKTPQQLEEFAKRSAGVTPEIAPVMDIFTRDLDALRMDEALAPIEKVRLAFQQLSEEQSPLKEILADADLFARIGDQAVEAWDFDRVTRNITQLRGALQSYHRLQIGGFGGTGDDYTEEVRKNVEDSIKYLKQLEQMLVPIGGTKASPMGLAGVPQFLDPQTQTLIHKRNLAQIRKYYETPADEGGAPRGEAFTYKYRVVDPSSKQVLTSMTEEFRKIGDEATTAGGKIGVFTQRSEDMLQSLQDRKGFGQAFSRVIRWGVASRTVYGLVGALNDMVNTISNVEMGMTVLRQVMNPLTTDFDGLQKSAIGFAQQFGTSIQKVLDGMRIYAQQGLAQQEVLDRTYASMLAVNVSTLNAADATEALTAAMKSYGREGESAVRFIDAWTQVETRHAITSKDLADAMRKSAAIAKTMGVSFHELNAITTAIGETTRMTGKEIGTAERFMFRRLQTEKAPKQLAQIGIPVVGGAGEIRSAFDILGDLAGKWDDLTSAQKVSLAESIGGVRHYNALIVLMDKWGDALSALEHSIDSKGTAERRNAIVMDTYAKKMEQLKASVAGLQAEFGKAFLPVAKGFIDSLRAIIDAFSNIPPWVKVASTALAGFFVMLSKGADIRNYLQGMFGGIGPMISDAVDEAKKQFKLGVFEITGKDLGGVNLTGLKQFTEVKHISELHTEIGKLTYGLAPLGRAWNNFLTSVFKGTAVSADKVSDVLTGMSTGISGFVTRMGAKAALGPVAGALTAALALSGPAIDIARYGVDKFGVAMGMTAEQTAKWTRENTNLVATFGPLVGSILLLEPALSKAWGGFKRLAMSSQDYEKSMMGLSRNQSEQLSNIKGMSRAYRNFEKRIEDMRKMQDPSRKEVAIEEGRYIDPYLEVGRVTEEVVKQNNALADSNSSLVVAYDSFGNAVMHSNGALKSFLETAEKSKLGEIFGTQLEVVKKHIEDLTDTGMLESFKRELKRFAGEIPGFGPALAKMIHVSPAKLMEEEVSKMNKLLLSREAFPLTTAFDKPLKERSESLKKVRESMQETYKDFRRVLAELPTEGMGRDRIIEAFTSPELREGFKIIAEIEPRLTVGREFEDVQMGGFINNLLKRTQKEVTKGASAEDVMGVEIMKRLFPDQMFDYTKEMTKGLMLEAGVAPRKVGEVAKSGERVFFTDEIAKQFKIAANQGILQIEQTAEGFRKETVLVFDKATSQLKEIPYEDVSRFVESIFPVSRIQEELTENLDALKEFLVGAEAGLVGLTAKEFKRSFDLGARFFGQIPTTTLMQTTKGYTPETGYGEVPIKTDWPELIEQFFFEPKKQYDLLIEQLQKVKLGDIPLDARMLKDLKEYQDIIKNNQVVVQYMSVFADLEKTLSEGSRVLEENLAAERTRYEYIKQTAGLLQGLPADFKEIDLGVQMFDELSPQQRMAFRDRGLPAERQGFLNTARVIRETEMERDLAATQAAEMRKAIAAMREISAVSKGLGVQLSPDEMGKYYESIVKTGDKVGGMTIKELSTLNEAANTTNDFLDRILRTLEGRGEIPTQAEITTMQPKQLMEFVARTERKRLQAINQGEAETAIGLGKVLDNVIEQSIQQFGPEATFDIAEQLEKGTGSMLKYLTPWSPHYFGEKAEFATVGLTQRALGVNTTEEFINAMEEVSPGISQNKFLQDLVRLQEENNRYSITDNKTLQQLLAVYSVSARFDKVGTDRMIRDINRQIGVLEDSKAAMEEGTDTSKIDAQIEGLQKQLTGAQEKAREQMFKQLIGPMALASEEMLKQLGMSERTIRILGAGAATLYGGAKLYEFATGEKVPEKLEKAVGAARERAEESRPMQWLRSMGRAVGIEDEADKLIREARTEAEAEGKPLTEKEIKDLQEQIKKSAEAAKEEKPMNILQELMVQFRKEREERAKTAADRMVNLVEDQNTILMGIYEKTGEVAENTIDFSKATHTVAEKEHKRDKDREEALFSNIKTMQDEYAAKNPAGMLTKVGFGLAAAGAGGYIKELGEMRNIINTMSGRAAKEADLMRRFIKENRKDVVEAIRVRQVSTLREAGMPAEELEKISKVLDPDEWLNRLIESIEKMISSAEGDAEKLTQQLISLKRITNDLPERIGISLEQAAARARESITPAATRLNIPGVGGALAGAGFETGAAPEITRPRSLEDLSGMEAAIASAREQGNTSLEKEILSYKFMQSLRESQIATIDENNKQMSRLEATLEQLKQQGASSSEDLLKHETQILQYREANEKAYTEVNKLTDALIDMSGILAADIFGNLLQNFRKMKEEFKATEFMEEFKLLGKGFDMILGGRHPLAPVYPTVDALKSGMPQEQLFGMDRFQMEIASMMGRRQRITGDVMATQQINRQLALMQEAQRPEDEKLQRQRTMLERYMGMLYEAQRGAELIPEPEAREEALTDIKSMMDRVREVYETAPKIEQAFTEEGTPFRKYTAAKLGEEEGRLKEIISKYGMSDQMLTELGRQTGLLFDIRSILGKKEGMDFGSWQGFVQKGSFMLQKEKELTAENAKNLASREEGRFAGVMTGPAKDYVLPTKEEAEAARKKSEEDAIYAPYKDTLAWNAKRWLADKRAHVKSVEEMSRKQLDWSNEPLGHLLDPAWQQENYERSIAGMQSRPIKALTLSDEIDEAVEAFEEVFDIMAQAAKYVKFHVNAWVSAVTAPPETSTNNTLQAQSPDKKQSGGHITGPGGPREDKVPIWASAGEYVIKASSSKKLGKDALNYINTTGQLPGLRDGGFADGGEPQKGRIRGIKEIMDTYYSGTAEFDPFNAGKKYAASKEFREQVKSAHDKYSGAAGNELRNPDSEALQDIRNLIPPFVGVYNKSRAGMFLPAVLLEAFTNDISDYFAENSEMSELKRKEMTALLEKNPDLVVKALSIPAYLGYAMNEVSASALSGSSSFVNKLLFHPNDVFKSLHQKGASIMSFMSDLSAPLTYGLSNLKTLLADMDPDVARGFQEAVARQARSAAEIKELTKGLADDFLDDPLDPDLLVTIAPALFSRTMLSTAGRASVIEGGLRKKRAGGSIYGVGGPREDRVPILASPGEYIIRASSSKKLGKQSLDYINTTGELPKFADGGDVPEWAIKHPNLYGALGAGKSLFGAATSAENWKEALGISSLERISHGEGSLPESIMNYVDVMSMAFPGIGKMTTKGAKLATQVGKKALTAGKASTGKMPRAVPEAFSTILERKVISEKIADSTRLLESMKIGQAGQTQHLVGTAREILYHSPYKDDILKVIPKGARYTGMSGAEAFVLELPNGKLMRIGDTVAPRPNVPGILQAESRKVFGAHQIEVVPRVKTTGVTKKMAAELRNELSNKYGIYLHDTAVGSNVGIYKGRPVVFDPGAVRRVGAPSPSINPSATVKFASGGAVERYGIPERFNSYGEYIEWYGKMAANYGLNKDPGDKYRGFTKLVEILKSEHKSKTVKGKDQDYWDRFKKRDMFMEAANRSMSQFTGEMIMDGITTNRDASGVISASNIKDRYVSETGKFVSIGAGKKQVFAINQGTKEDPKWLLTNRPELTVGMQTGGVVSDWTERIKEWLVGRAEPPPEGTLSAAEAIRRQKEREERIKEMVGEDDIPKLSRGTPFVPFDSVVQVHKGEAVIPAKYNMGGFVGAPKYAEGGGVMAQVLNTGEEIGRKIAEVLEKVELTATLKDDTVKFEKDTIGLDSGSLLEDLRSVKLQVEDVNIANVDEISDSLKRTLESVNLAAPAGVGADTQNKLDVFMESLENKLDRQDALIVEKNTEFEEKFTLIELTNGTISRELVSIKSGLNDLLDKSEDMYTVQQHNIDLVEERSRLEAKLTELLSDFKSEEINPIKSQLGTLGFNMTSFNNEVSNIQDLLNALNNRLSLAR